MDFIDKRDEVLRLFLEHGITENTENDLTKTDLAECAEQIVKKLTIPVVVLQSEQFSLSDIYKIAQNYTEEQFIEMVKHVQG